jgi:hypothetical protein
MAKLNARAKKILQAKASKFKNGANFSIILLGDSHIGQINCTNKWYTELLKKIRAKGAYTAVHGGDASDNSTKLKNYVNISKKVLGYSNTVKDEKKTPLFTNIGNHDYKLGANQGAGVNIDKYNELIGNDNFIIKLYKGAKGPKIAIVFINTGYTVSGQLPGNKDFKTELDKLAKKMSDIIKSNNNIRFIIDMHIPPKIPKNAHFNTDHTLNPKYNDIFRKFMQKHPARILAIVAHHKHGDVQSSAYHYTFSNKNVTKKYNIPLYLTAQGGHCDHDPNHPIDAQYSFYRMYFKMLGNHYEIDNVYRYNMKKVGSKYVLSKQILINK